MTIPEPLRLLGALLLTLGFLLTSVLAIIYVERKVVAFIQDRFGPYHTGKWGVLQTVADTIKLLLKEDVVPAKADKVLHLMAPIIFFAPVLGAFVVLPFADSLTAVDLNIGVLYLVAIGSLGIIGIIAAAWGSNNKYSLLGGMRAAAQLVSYEIPMVLAMVIAIMLGGSLSLVSIVRAQEAYWFVLLQPFAFLTYLLSGIAETNRNPFDLPEAESELVAGFMTEYSGVRWAMFYLGEYGNMTVVSAVAATLFLGGWGGPFLTGIFGVVWFLLKVYFLMFCFMWFRGTFPRLRADQLMEFSWKVLIPLALLNIGLTGLAMLLFPEGYTIPVAVVGWTMLLGFAFFLPRIVARGLGVTDLVRQRAMPRREAARPP